MSGNKKTAGHSGINTTLGSGEINRHPALPIDHNSAAMIAMTGDG
jgi:hypothetical protein